MRKIGGLLKKLVLIIIAVYSIITFFNQGKILKTYAANSNSLDKQIAEATQKQEELNTIKKNANSEEYIEEMAREKLDMYLPNERIYINNEQ